MAHDVKLDVYTLQVKRHGKEEYLNFDSFYKIPDNDDTKDVNRPFKDFFTDYVKSYENKFWVQDSSGKAINLSSENLHFGSKNQIVYGQVEGGTTGLGSKIKTRDNISDESAFHVAKDNVNSIPYYFLLWVPNDSNLGLLIVQALGNKTVGDVFKAHLRKFFNQNTAGLSLLINEHIPLEAEKRMRERGYVKSVILRRAHLPSSKAEKLLGLKYVTESINIEVRISGLKFVQGIEKKLEDFLTGKTAQLFDIETMEDIGLDGKHEVLVQYEHDGKTAIGKMSQGFKLSPSYYIEEKDIRRDAYFHPEFNSIHKYCLSFLEALKREIGYIKTKS